MLRLSDFSLIKISGDNATTFLQGQLTADVTTVSEQHMALSAVCNHQGRVLAVFYLLKLGADFLCVLVSVLAAEFVQHLQKFAVFSKVAVTDVTTEFHLYGFIGSDLPEKIKLSSTQCHLVKGPTDRYLILSINELDVNCHENVALWKTINILSCLPTIYCETAWKITPHMLNLHQLGGISFNKGCYVGQEIIARTHYLGKSKRHLYRAELTTAIEIKPGQLIDCGPQEAGLVIDAAILDSSTQLLVVLQGPIDRDFMLQEDKLMNITQSVASGEIKSHLELTENQ